MKKFLITSSLVLLCTKSAFALVMDLDKIVVTASRLAQTNYEISGDVTVLSQEDIQASNARNLPELLSEALGIHVYQNSTAKSASVDIRGYGETASRNVLILVNDRKINAIDISSPDLIQIPLQAVEKIEVIRGAGSVLYGDNATGGVVNIITKKGAGKMSGSIGGTYGSYDSSSADMELSGAKDNVRYYFYSKYANNGGYRTNSGLLARDTDGRVSYEALKNLKVDLNFGWHEDNQELPSGLLDTQIHTMGPRATTAPNDFSDTRDRYADMAFDFTPWLVNQNYIGKLVVNVLYRNRDTLANFLSLSSSVKNAIDTTGITGKYVFNRQLFDRDVNFVTGIDYYSYDNDIIYTGSVPLDATITKKELGFYGFLETETLDHLFLSGGLRYHRAKYDFTERLKPLSQKENPDAFVYTAGIKYVYGKGSNAYLNFQKTFRFLATDEWFDTFNGTIDTTLKQQTGDQVEAGIRQNFKDIFTTSITPYFVLNHDEIYYNPMGGPYGYGGNANYDKTRRMGLEFEQDADLKKWLSITSLDQLKFWVSYQYIHAKFVDGTSDGKRIPLVPAQQAHAGLVARFGGHYSATLLWKFVGSQYAIGDVLNVARRIKPYYVTDLKLSYNRKNMEVFCAVNNLFDERYSSAASYSSYYGASNLYNYPSPGRNFTTGLKIKF